MGAPFITIIGYGNQGRAWAANLRDSGWRVRVSGRVTGHSIAVARADGFETATLEQIARAPGLCALLIPDLEIAPLLKNTFSGPRDAGSFVFAHGFAVACQPVADAPIFAPQDDVILVAPKGIGPKLRENFTRGSGVLGVLGVHQDSSGQAWSRAEAVAEGLGCKRVGILRASFAEEARADLLSEQALLCGPVPRLLAACLRLLAREGVNEQVARFECASELRLMAEMMETHGVQGMMAKISSTALFGGLRAAERLVPEAKLEQELTALWAEICDGRFARELQAEHSAGYPFCRREVAKLTEKP